VGLDLESVEPGFDESMLKNPERMHALHDFVAKGLMRKDAIFYSLYHHDSCQGLFVVPAAVNQLFNEVQKDNAYLHAGLLMLQRQLNHFELKARLQKFSIYDDVSEALNADMTTKKIREEISRARRLVKPVSILLVAIDRLNDLSLSQNKGSIDKLLKSFADLLHANSRLNDFSGRVAHDQFAVVLPHTDKKGAAIKAERLRKIIEAADFAAFLGPGAKLTVSIGVSEYPNVCHDSDGLLRTAESALLEIKKVGFNRVSVASPPTRFVPDFVVKDAKNISAHGG
jgi:diguanylate cyclase (GGDEF)-like protein